MPNSTDAQIWNQTIQELSMSYGGPLFDGHVTVFSTVEETKNIEVISHYLAHFSPIVLYPVGIRFDHAYTKSCYIEFENIPILERQRRSIQEYFGSSNEQSDFQPHMSLFYGTLSENQRDAILEKVKLPTMICFDRFWTMQTTKSTLAARDVAKWEKLFPKSS
jgi:hypothetical protein